MPSFDTNDKNGNGWNTYKRYLIHAMEEHQRCIEQNRQKIELLANEISYNKILDERVKALSDKVEELKEQVVKTANMLSNIPQEFKTRKPALIAGGATGGIIAMLIEIIKILVEKI